jgi:glycine C-acetyltransferase
MPESLERYLDEQLDGLKQQGLLRSFRILEGSQGARARIDGQDVINLSSNNYLGLANHPQLKQAAIGAIDQLGVGSGAVRTIIGTMAIHEELERRLAEFKRTAATLVLQSGFTANAAVLGTILAEGDLVISDELNHASIIDGIRLTKAARRVYAHSDTVALEQVLKQTQGQYAKTLIVTDGVFSMDGDIAPLDRIADLAEHYGAITMGTCFGRIGPAGQRHSQPLSPI